MGSKKQTSSVKNDKQSTQKSKVIDKHKNQHKKAKMDEIEIDDIFNISKNQKQQQKQQHQQQSEYQQQLQNKNVENKNDIFGEQNSSGRKRTEEGYAIYTEEELGFRDNCGETDLCPFDCDCCF